MYRIGEFAILTGVSVKTLRYYDYINLLKPSKIDQYTNYRYYTNEELTKFQKIEYLKKLGFTLEEIKANLANLTPHCIEQKKEELKDENVIIIPPTKDEIIKRVEMPRNEVIEYGNNKTTI